jgi:hypothetical protein
LRVGAKLAQSGEYARSESKKISGSCGLVVGRQKDCGQTTVGFRDQPKFGAVGGVINRKQAQASAERQFVFSPVGVGADIRPTLFIHKRCGRLIETLPALQHDPNRPEDVLKVDADEDGGGGDDTADALRYLVATKSRTITQRKLRGV